MVFHEDPISSHRQPFELFYLRRPIVLNRYEEVGSRSDMSAVYSGRDVGRKGFVSKLHDR